MNSDTPTCESALYEDRETVVSANFKALFLSGFLNTKHLSVGKCEFVLSLFLFWVRRIRCVSLDILLPWSKNLAFISFFRFV